MPHSCTRRSVRQTDAPRDIVRCVRYAVAVGHGKRAQARACSGHWRKTDVCQTRVAADIQRLQVGACGQRSEARVSDVCVLQTERVPPRSTSGLRQRTTQRVINGRRMIEPHCLKFATLPNKLAGTRWHMLDVDVTQLRTTRKRCERVLLHVGRWRQDGQRCERRIRLGQFAQVIRPVRLDAGTGGGAGGELLKVRMCCSDKQLR